MSALLLAALTIGVVHTLVGPDHYLPFILLGRAEGWTQRKTLAWTAVCGVAHVLSSVALGGVGIALGWAVGSMEQVEAVRGEVASFGLIGFGLVYGLWGLWRAGRAHAHAHVHADGTIHTHAHGHDHAAEAAGVAHAAAPHEESAHVAAHRRTMWTLFIIFALGPCEPLIPLLLVPATAHSLGGVFAVVGLYGAATVLTMLLAVGLASWGVGQVRLGAMQRWAHAMAGFAILVSGVVVKAFGL